MQQPKHFIIVEDEELHINLLTRSLRRFDDMEFVVTEAHNGLDGMNAIETHFSSPQAPPIYLLLDLNLPGLNGFEIMERINTRSYRSKIRLIILTTSDAVTDLSEAAKLGYDHYLVKPIDYRTLFPIIMGHTQAS